LIPSFPPLLIHIVALKDVESFRQDSDISGCGEPTVFPYSAPCPAFRHSFVGM
jgi:hypothetical protein